mmetsp:Transcript_2283/g.3472  ORF Transcript_2283/g.3472 Transcript_2283/m.3472 type:complete len:237 (+) Transcript_2283:549-1259(+)
MSDFYTTFVNLENLAIGFFIWDCCALLVWWWIYHLFIKSCPSTYVIGIRLGCFENLIPLFPTLTPSLGGGETRSLGLRWYNTWSPGRFQARVHSWNRCGDLAWLERWCGSGIQGDCGVPTGIQRYAWSCTGNRITIFLRGNNVCFLQQCRCRFGWTTTNTLHQTKDIVRAATYLNKIESIRFRIFHSSFYIIIIRLIAFGDGIKCFTFSVGKDRFGFVHKTPILYTILVRATEDTF